MRACEGLPATTPHLANGTSKGDLKTAVDHINDNYVVRDKKSGARMTSVYMIGTSMGGMALGRYLQTEGEKALQKVDATALYCAPYSIKKNEHYCYYESYFGILFWVLGMMFTGEIRKASLPSLRKAMKPKNFAELE